MNITTLGCDEVAGKRALPAVIAFAASCAMLCLASSHAAQEGPDKEAAGGKRSQSAGIYFDAEANGKDVGLPIYPRARPRRDKDENQSSAKFGLWGSSFAFKLAVVKLESEDAPQKVAAFYKKALAKYGTVLDCAAAPPEAADKSESKSSNQISCESDKPGPGEMTFKAGTKEKQHIVGIQPSGTGSLFELVYFESPDADKKK